MERKIHFGYWQYGGVSESWGFISLDEAPYTAKDLYYAKQWIKRYRRYMQDDSYDIQVA